ncbi:MAG: hypothetical protein HRU28_01770 [Rhizobiales bacterium]|nr:hypothetical protein [Hyphomicrobiales bacterium]
MSTITNNMSHIEVKEECLTIISPLANIPLFEFHRQRLAKQGYTLTSKILKHRFEMVDENGVMTNLIDGQSYYAATYTRQM